MRQFIRGTRTTWVGVPATIAADGAKYLSYGAGTAYGFLTLTAPTDLQTRSLPPVVDPPVVDPPQPPAPGPGPEVKKPEVKPTPKPKAVKADGDVSKTGAKGAVTVSLSRRPGAKPGKTYKVKVVRRGKVVATGTVKGKTLKLSVKKVGKGKRAKYPKLAGRYTLAGAKGVSGVTTTQLTIG